MKNILFLLIVNTFNELSNNIEYRNKIYNEKITNWKQHKLDENNNFFKKYFDFNKI